MRRALSLPRPLRCALLAWSLLLALAYPRGARAEQPLDVAAELRGIELGQKIALYEDALGEHGIEQISAPEHADRFVASRVAAPNLGFTSSVYWVRLTVRNSSAEPRPWLLELAYPLLDQVTLYLPRGPAAGFDLRVTGDMRPFSERDLAYRNFVFSLEEPPESARTYYLRVATTGSLSIPLVAWSMKQFLEHQHLDWSALCVFYGVILVMACYNASVWGFTRQPGYLPYVGYIVAVWIYVFTSSGHTFQLLLPNDSALVHRLTPASAAAALTFSCAVVATYLPERHALNRALICFAYFFLALSLLSFVAPYWLVIKALAVSALLVPLFVALSVSVVLLRLAGQQAKLFLIGWGSSLLGVVVVGLQNTGLVPRTFFTAWSLQIGVSIQLVLLSSALADKLNRTRANVNALNAELSHKLAALSAALTQAEQAGLRAEQATRVKDEFMATMSHEFRTPLNPIINFPQGLIDDFVPVHHALCSACGQNFVLDEGETISPRTPCPECAAEGALEEHNVLQFRGDADEARSFLNKVERSGIQLLQLVNGILDYSKMEAGHLRLSREPCAIADLFAELARELRPRAQSAGVELNFAPLSRDFELYADPQRIREVLVHLVDNAIKFSPRGGAVAVAVQVREHENVFAVCDRGIGVAEENLEAIFTSFEQVDKGNTRKYGGTGLGLTISRALVRMHGGQMWVESKLGLGSTFFFSIPHQEPARAHAPEPPESAAPGPRRRPA